MKALSDFLRPEFISRVDEIIVFNPLSFDDMTKIAGLMLEELREPLEEKGIKLAYSEEAQRLLAQKAGGGKSGARDLRNVIRREIEDKIASIIVNEDGIPPKAIVISESDGNIMVLAG